jgi:hypothetical protein
MFGKPQGGDDEYTEGFLNESFVVKPGKVPGQEDHPKNQKGKVTPETPVSDEDIQERTKRVKKVDAKCAETLVKDTDFSTTVKNNSEFESLVLGKGEVVKASISCVAIRGMPACGGHEEFMGEGLLVLSELDGMNRLHFAMYESTAEFDAEEVWKEQVSGWCCCKKYSHTVFADYQCVRSQALTFTTLPITNNIFDVYGSMVDTSKLSVYFGGDSKKPEKSCCKGCCSACSLCWQCRCRDCCCILYGMCCPKHEKNEGAWAKRTFMKPVLQRMLEHHTSSEEDATYRFPKIEAISDKEKHTGSLEKVHIINFKVLSSDATHMNPCVVFASPDEPALKVAKFAAALGSLTSKQGAPSQATMGGKLDGGMRLDFSPSAGPKTWRKRCCAACCCCDCKYACYA